MVAPEKHNRIPHVGSFGDPIRMTQGSTWTDRELRAIKRRARFTSEAAVIRSLIPPEAPEDLIRETEAEHVQIHRN